MSGKPFILRKDKDARDKVQANLFRYIADLPTSHNWRVVIKRHVEKRSLGQNAFYWGPVLTTIAAETGHTSKELHEYFLEELAPRITVEAMGKTITRPVRTSEMDAKQMLDYTNHVQSAAADMGILIPTMREAA